MYTRFHEETVQRGMNGVRRNKPFYHIPPTAYPIRKQDFYAGISAGFRPAESFNKFKDELSKKIGAECNLVSSGRSAMTLALLSLKDMKKGWKVVIPAYSCSTVLQAVITAGLEPVFCDVNPTTLDFDYNQLARVITEETLAVIGVHLYGLAQNFSLTAKKTSDKNTFFIEDAAQCFGGRIENRMVGTQGDISIFSLGRGKNLPTNGGGVIASKPELQTRLEQTVKKFTSPTSARFRHTAALAGYAAAVNPVGWWFIARSWLNPADAGSDYFQLPEIQHKSLSAFQAGLGSSLLKRSDEVYQIWRKNAAKLSGLLKNFSFLTIPQTPQNTEDIYLRFPIILDQKHRAERLTKKLNNAGIGASRSYRFTLPELHQTSVSTKKFPGASQVAQCLLTLPTNHFLNDAAIDIIDQIFHEEEKYLWS